MPYDHVSENLRQKCDNQRVHNNAADDVERDCLTGAFGRVEICGEQGIDASDDKAPAVFPHMA